MTEKKDLFLHPLCMNVGLKQPVIAIEGPNGLVGARARPGEPGKAWVSVPETHGFFRSWRGRYFLYDVVQDIELDLEE